MLLIFQYHFSNWEHGFVNCLFASHVTEPGSTLTEPGAVIKFSDFSSYPVHVCYNDYLIPVITSIRNNGVRI